MLAIIAISKIKTSTSNTRDKQRRVDSASPNYLNCVIYSFVVANIFQRLKISLESFLSKLDNRSLM